MSITAVLSDGLGNQMFQYASARALSLARGTSLVLDLRVYRDSPKRPWILDLPLSATIRTFGSEWAPTGPMGRIKRRIADRRRYRQAGHGYDPRLLDLPGGTVLMGYFQSPRHFDHIHDVIARECGMETLGEVTANPAFERFGLADCVGIHVRRGDYLLFPEFELNDAQAYYRGAMAEVRERGERAVIFSDDIAWCREQDCFAGASFYPPSDGPPYIDMYALSRCGRLVIANSTFSWWAGWFAHRRGAEVTAPKSWILGYTSKEFGIVPPTWRVL
jgi:hypothetical protein